jgi:hypothetical protein
MGRNDDEYRRLGEGDDHYDSDVEGWMSAIYMMTVIVAMVTMGFETSASVVTMVTIIMIMVMFMILMLTMMMLVGCRSGQVCLTSRG